MNAPVVVPYADAIAAFARVIAAAETDRDQLAALKGPRAVAEAAHTPGGPSVAEIEQLHLSLQRADGGPARAA